MSYNVIVPNLYVGDYEAAKNLTLLEGLHVTHIISCGFDMGYFQSLRKFQYFCIDITDSPSSNLLQYLPRVVKFMEKAINTNDDGNEDSSDKNSVIFVHCVHGQSRSCAVCVAYLIQQAMKRQNNNLILDNIQKQRIISDDEITTKRALHLCYDQVLQSRTQMAINPGFVKQLEIFRRMKCIQATTLSPSPSKRIVGSMLLSKPHAYFRSFRAMTQFQETGNVTNNFCPLPTHEEEDENRNNLDTFCCLKCHSPLFTDMNILQELTKEEITMLPVSDYWKDSQGGIEYYDNHMNCSQLKQTSRQFDAALKRPNEVLKIEPMQWMKPQILNDEFYVSNGDLVCYKCSNPLGYWDWLSHFHSDDAPTAILVLKNRIFL